MSSSITAELVDVIDQPDLRAADFIDDVEASSMVEGRK